LEAQQQAPSTKIDFSKIKQGEISYDSKSKLYYTRDSSGKLVVTGSGNQKEKQGLLNIYKRELLKEEEFLLSL